jgi:branched-chain amino acid transport system permease protein
MEKLAVLLLAGVTNGSVYGLIGLSLALIYSTSRIINFAQGDFVMLGTMCTIAFLATMALPVWAAVIVILLVQIAAALLFHQFVYRPLNRRKAPPLTIMIGTFAGSVALAGIALIIWGPSQLFVPAVFSIDPMQIGLFTTTAQQLAIVLSFAGLMLVTWYLLYGTSFGLAVRAVGVNPQVALLMGIRAESVVRFSFIFSALVSGISGILIGPALGGQFSMGVMLTVKGFMAAILGGLGSPFAAAAGGIAIGIIEALASGYGSSLYAEPIIFALLLLVLLVRPNGLLGEFEAVRR